MSADFEAAMSVVSAKLFGMRASRLVSIVLLLQARGRMTARDLAEALEASERTVYRDIVSLSAAGVPVYGTPRRDGGFQLVGGYRTRLTGLTEQEVRTLFLAGVPAAAAALGLGTEANAARLKLLAAVPATGRDHAERVHLDPTPWGEVADPEPSLPLLHQAVWNDRLVRVRYGTSPKPFTIAPLGLVCKGASWYLLALRRREPRTYRVSRLGEVTLDDRTFRRPDGFDLATHWRAASQAYAETFARTTVRLRLRGGALDRATWVQARSRTIGAPDGDGWTDVELVLEDADNALTVIRVLGDEVIVVEPEGLRHQAIAMAQAFLDANGASHTPGAQNTFPSGSAITQ
ncbi:helix-turn-helix transcriptional regulator [Flindersiella endophytica]